MLTAPPSSQSSDVPDWMFIGWISQMVALLNKAEGPAVHKILLSIATNYPQALFYQFKISSSTFESHPPGEANQDTVDKYVHCVHVQYMHVSSLM